MPNDFDIASLNYDETFTFSRIGLAQRNQVFKHLKPIINQSKKLSILELNCGTGEDALEFANLGHTVLATDISEGMISKAKEKTYPKNLEFKIQDINTITKTTFNTSFDLIFSNFGGINCLSKEQIDSFIKKSIDLLNPNGKLVMIIMPKHSIWERLYFSLKGNLKKAKRRNTKSNIIVNVDGVPVSTWYYNPKDITSTTEHFYHLKKVKPVGLAIPPSYLEDSFLVKKPILNLLVGIDNAVTNSFWAKYADHFLIELIKK